MHKAKLVTGFAALVSLSAALTLSPLGAQNADDNARIAAEAKENSEIMETARELIDDIGARLPNSPQMRAAEQWALDKFESWGLENVHREGFEFGRGWSITSSHVQMTEPRDKTLSAIPVAWTPPTGGKITAPVVLAAIEDEADIAKWQGKLQGKIVMVDTPYPFEPYEKPQFERFSDGDFEEIEKVKKARGGSFSQKQIDNYVEYLRLRDRFFATEGVRALVQISWSNNMLLQGFGFTYKDGKTATLPAVEMAAEDYRRLARMIENGAEPVLSVDNDVVFHDGDSQAYNIIADIKGSDDSGEYVMAGAHLDSWVSGDGASDNGAGVAIVMEAARLIRASSVKPKRTIRFALWNAEEQGLLGSAAYADRHLGELREAGADAGKGRKNARKAQPELLKKPGYGMMKAYFNVDNGSGRIRGIYGEWEEGARPILRRWLAPFEPLDAHRVGKSGVDGSDHVSFQRLGLPGYQFMQDPLDYDGATHHNNSDTYDHLSPEDMKQAAIVLAGILVAAANDDETLPQDAM